MAIRKPQWDLSITSKAITISPTGASAQAKLTIEKLADLFGRPFDHEKAAEAAVQALLAQFTKATPTDTAEAHDE